MSEHTDGRSQFEATGRRGRRRYLDDVYAEIALVLRTADVDEKTRGYLETRWAAQVQRATHNVGSNKRNYYTLRIPAVVCALVLPAVTNPTVDAEWMRWAAWVLSVVVAVATGLESVFRYGNRWRLYRKLLDSLRNEAWAFQMSLGPEYTADQSAAARTFITRCEEILARHGDSYVAEVVVLGERGTTPQTATGRTDMTS
jgi:hypothetical protein